MSAVNARAGLIERIDTIDDLTVLGAEPWTLQTTAAAIVSLIGGGFAPGGQVRAKTWRFAVRIVVQYQDAEAAEAELVPWADLVTAAILDDLTLGGRASVVPRWEISAEGSDGYYTVNEKTHRSMVFRLDVMDKL
jgi:hypothetical protein